MVNPQGERTTLLYDAAGRKIASYLANGPHASLTYDPVKRNAEVRHVGLMDDRRVPELRRALWTIA